ncbi:hypothetical protein BST61_g6753 [Cercospora zeina]
MVLTTDSTITSMIFASHFFSNRTKSAQLPRHETLSAIKAGNSQVPTSAGSRVATRVTGIASHNSSHQAAIRNVHT